MVEKASYGFGVARSATFITQNLLMLAVVENSRFKDPKFANNMRTAIQDLNALLKKDSQNIARGVYPVEVLWTESPRQFLKRYPKILWDSLRVSRRRLAHRSKDFNAEAAEYLNDVPDYFQRNFHFQTGGYLTEESAKLYEHQVEILFAGAADAMRRLLLPLMREHFLMSQGEGLHFLEVAAGTGRLSRFVKLTFPKAKVTVLDLSHPYLKKAQENLKQFKKVDFVQGDASALPFREEQFDAVVSCFLFHELPIEERRRAVSEAYRVLKPGGFFGLVDSVQLEDKRDFEWALKQFPVDFHEPFYKNYLQNPMEGVMKNQGFEDIRSEIGFFSKAVGGRK